MWSIIVNSGEDYLRNHYLIENPLGIITLLGFYFFFVNKLGPLLMKNRRPMELKNTMTLYNIVQIVANAILFYLGIMEVIRTSSSFICIRNLSSPDGQYLAELGYAYFILKIVDLLDTVFFVLRKKQNQISFLHLYHHSTMIVFSWAVAKWTPGGHVAWIGVVNALVHCIMYSYYLLTIWHPEAKSSFWWKKYLTQIQMLQHGGLGISMAGALLNPYCDYSRIWTSLTTVQAIVMFYLFAKFYRKSYGQQNAKQR